MLRRRPRPRARTIQRASYDDDRPIIAPSVPVVDYDAAPKVRIYDAANDGLYWYREIGFLKRRIDD